MKLSFVFVISPFLFNALLAANLVEEIVTNFEATKISVENTPPAFSYNFQTHDCPKKLSEVVSGAVTSSISDGRLPILVCDLDETLVKGSGSGLALPTDFYKHLNESGAIAKSHGVLALTARLVTVDNILGITHSQLSICTPEFAERIRSDTNLGGLTSLDLSSVEKSFLYNAGVIVMGENKGNFTKRQIIDAYLKFILVGSNSKYDLIFIDNCIGWFNDFCNGIAFDSKIIKGHFFHYDWDKAEGYVPTLTASALAGLNQSFAPKPIKPSSSKTAGRFEISDFFDTDDDTDTDTIYTGGVTCIDVNDAAEIAEAAKKSTEKDDFWKDVRKSTETVNLFGFE
jgi:hypothetical protein